MYPLRFVDVWHRPGHMDAEEADEWRRPILARQQFLEMDEHSPFVRG